MTTQTQTTAHTPGPWFTANGGQSIRVENRDFLVAKVGNSRPADARLIAAAPELLALVKRQLNGMTASELREWTAQAITAIARATGEAK